MPEAGPRTYSVLSFPQKNTATVPGPVWLPIVVPTEYISTLPFMDRLADLRDEGKSLQEVYEWASANRLRLHHWFFSTDLTFYIRGGRISKTAGFVGGMLSICPLLNHARNTGRQTYMKDISAFL